MELSPDDFQEMLILDGILIIELIRKCELDNLRKGDEDDTTLQYEQVLSQACHDLMLIENQIPFFALDQLFSMTNRRSRQQFIFLI